MSHILLTVLLTLSVRSVIQLAVICIAVIILLIISLYFRRTSIAGRFAASGVNNVIINWHSNVKDKSVTSDGDVIIEDDKFEFFTDLFGIWFMGIGFFPKPIRLDFNLSEISRGEHGIPVQRIKKFEDPYTIPERFALDFISYPIETTKGVWIIRFSVPFVVTQLRKLHELDRNETWFTHFNGVFNEMLRTHLVAKANAIGEKLTIEIILQLRAGEFVGQLTDINSSLSPKGLQMIIHDFKIEDIIPGDKATIELVAKETGIQIAIAEAATLREKAKGESDAGIEKNKIRENLLKIDNEALAVKASIIKDLGPEQADALALTENKTLTTYVKGATGTNVNVGK